MARRPPIARLKPLMSEAFADTAAFLGELLDVTEADLGAGAA